jgi:hypothetical protein
MLELTTIVNSRLVESMSKFSNEPPNERKGMFVTCASISAMYDDQLLLNNSSDSFKKNVDREEIHYQTIDRQSELSVAIINNLGLIAGHRAMNCSFSK